MRIIILMITYRFKAFIRFDYIWPIRRLTPANRNKTVFVSLHFHCSKPFWTFMSKATVRWLIMYKLELIIYFNSRDLSFIYIILETSCIHWVFEFLKFSIYFGKVSKVVYRKIIIFWLSIWIDIYEKKIPKFFRIITLLIKKFFYVEFIRFIWAFTILKFVVFEKVGKVGTHVSAQKFSVSIRPP